MFGLSLFIVIASVCIATGTAEPPRWRSNTRFNQFQRQQAAPSQWKPSAGVPEKAPQTTYGAPTPAPSYGPPPAPVPSYGPPPPAPSYGPPPPASSYGPPPSTPSYGPPQEEPSLTSTTEVSITTEADSEGVDIPGEEQSGQLLQNGPNGFYYIYHPNGVLQKVLYATDNDEKKMSFTAKLKYENVEPVRAPVYTYDPETYVLRKVFDPTVQK